jgi:hypothetical protein
MDFDEDRQTFAELAGCGVELLRERNAVYGIDPVEKLGREPGFVALKVAYEVPASAQIGELRTLRLHFLDAILAEMAKARLEGCADRFNRESFRHGDERNFIGATPCPLGRPHYAFPQTRKICGDVSDFQRRHARDFSTRHEALVTRGGGC